MQFVNPLQGTLTDGFGPRGVVPGVGDMGTHTGQDIAAPMWTVIDVAAPGIVTRKWFEPNHGGHMVSVGHADGWETRYAHMAVESTREIGERVDYGQSIGNVGSTGAANGPHLHFETLKNGVFVDPLPYLNGDLEMDYATLQKINQIHADMETLMRGGVQKGGTDENGKKRTGKQTLPNFLKFWEHQYSLDRRRAERIEARSSKILWNARENRKTLKEFK